MPSRNYDRNDRLTNSAARSFVTAGPSGSDLLMYINLGSIARQANITQNSLPRSQSTRTTQLLHFSVSAGGQKLGIRRSATLRESSPESSRKYCRGVVHC